MMKDLDQVQAKLRRRGIKQYALLAGCLFFSALLITAYSCMMRSPTVLQVLPEGGDSRKQVIMVFVLTALGCAVFTIYAASLFFRYRSRETGILLALGACRKQVSIRLLRELLGLGALSCALGMVLGAPLAMGVWQIFRTMVVDSQEMILSFDPLSYLLPLAFSAFVLAALAVMSRRSVARADILDIVQQSRRSEPIKAVPGYYAWLGPSLLAVGGLLGYLTPSFCVLVLHWYAPGIIAAPFYLLALAGLYMVLLHTVVNGWHKKKHRYKNLIATSMMKFQGRQTVNNMLVMSLLIGGAFFASFYTPMMCSMAEIGTAQWQKDYVYFFRNDQPVPGKTEVLKLAEKHAVEISRWQEEEMLRLAVDGMYHRETEGAMGTTWEQEYREQLSSALFLSESGYEALSGQQIHLEPGQISPVFLSNGDDAGRFGGDASLVTNTLTGEQWRLSPGPRLCNDMLFGRYVVADEDYAKYSEGLDDTWTETMICFDIDEEEGTYPFAKDLFNAIVDASGPEVLNCGIDPVEREWQIEEDGEYFMDKYTLEPSQRDSSQFRNGWMYMPMFRILDDTDFVKTMAVYLMLFVFIALVCFAAVYVIGYTRCMTICLNDKRVYEDMKKLGASSAYLRRSVKDQISRVFLVPSIVGTVAIGLMYAMIMYFNDMRLSVEELLGMSRCLLLVLFISCLSYFIYRFTRKKVYAALDI